ncbi:MAG TPA: hypothetical protein VHP83_12355 [Aggregatilineaceae bacterium]|nr:hypothetical protein [Aggregatilineaceae bacterium]
MMQRVADHLNRWPRLGRIALIFGITLELIILLVWDALLLDLLGEDPAASSTPFIIAVVAGVGIYVWGWWALVGFSDKTWRIGKPGAVFALVGFLGLLAVIGMIIYAAASGNVV